jgi:hypothetical protein
MFTGISLENLKQTDHFKDLEINESIILRKDLKELRREGVH